jgi:hypothetical protein
MSPLASFIPQCEPYPFRKSLFEDVRIVEHKEVSNDDCYYLLTNITSPTSLMESSNVITHSTKSTNPIFFEQLDLIAFTNKMFQGAQPMSGDELRVLKNTASRLISKTPTSLRK